MKKIIALLLSVIMCVGLTACASDDSAQSENGLKDVTVVLDYVPNTNHTGFYVAQALGYYEAQGLNVTVIEPGDNDSTTLCAVGRAEFAVSYQENVTYARTASEPLPIRAIATIIQHNTSGFIFRPDSGIESPKDFEGKVYAGWQAPSEAAVLEAVMKQDGADFSKLTMVGASGSGLDSMTNGIDIQWEFEGWAIINDRMNGHEVGYLPVNELDSRLDYYTPVIITNETMIDENPETVQAFMTATKQGYEYAIANPDASAEILAKVIPETDPEFIKESQKFLSEQYSMDSDTWGLMKDEVWDGYTEFMYEYGLIDKSIPADQQYTNQFIK
ncbi:MAG: ABC transporter substrate-binding protein [Oscillospiraceae bacterium]|nr:ABC transporter substrate-binding protein [Oscillospiraceae bacterium]